MYWYLSFLRPPPVSTPISTGSITITPQIANDLRTELLFVPTDIQYTWQRTGPELGEAISSTQTILWNPPESTYKSITVPLPASSKPGESWRLSLHVGPYISSPLCISSYAKPGPEIISVWSEPITLARGEPSNLKGNVKGVGHDGKKKDKKGSSSILTKKDEGKKQGRITRNWTIGDSVLEVVEQTSFDLDKKIWDSGLGLSGWLYQYLHLETPRDKTRDLFELLRSKRTSKIVEIGSGTGLVSIALGLAFRQLSDIERDVEIIATDLAIELMDENLAISNLGKDSMRMRVKAKVLDWDQTLPSWVGDDGKWPDLIVAADVTYNTASFPSLLKTLTSLLRPDDGPRPPLLLAYKQRDLAERDLWKMLESEGIELRHVDTISGAEEEGEVEIWLGKAKL